MFNTQSDKFSIKKYVVTEAGNGLTLPLAKEPTRGSNEPAKVTLITDAVVIQLNSLYYVKRDTPDDFYIQLKVDTEFVELNAKMFKETVL